MKFIWVFLLPFALLGVVLWLAHRGNQRRRVTWRQAADALGLRFMLGSWSETGEISGRHLGRQVRVYTFRERSGRSTYTYTRIEVELQLALRLRIFREGLWQKVTKVFGAEDLQTGDDAFDRRFMIQGDDAETIRRILSPQVREMLLHCDMTCGGVEVSNQGVVWQVQGHLSSSARIVSLVRSLSETAQAVADAAQTQVGSHATRTDFH